MVLQSRCSHVVSSLLRIVNHIIAQRTDRELKVRTAWVSSDDVKILILGKAAHLLGCKLLKGSGHLSWRVIFCRELFIFNWTFLGHLELYQHQIINFKTPQHN